MRSLIAGLRCTVWRGAIVLSAVYAVPAWAATPCINTNSQSALVRRTMAVQPSGGGEITVTGAVASLDAATGEVGVNVLGLEGKQQIKPGVISFATQEPSMAAQMPIPVKTPLGLISAAFPLSELSVEGGIIRYPGCVMPEAGHEISFTGNLTFDGGKMKVDGAFFDYAPPADGEGGPGIVGGKRG